MLIKVVVHRLAGSANHHLPVLREFCLKLNDLFKLASAVICMDLLWHMFSWSTVFHVMRHANCQTYLHVYGGGGDGEHRRKQCEEEGAEEEDKKGSQQ